MESIKEFQFRKEGTEFILEHFLYILLLGLAFYFITAYYHFSPRPFMQQVDTFKLSYSRRAPNLQHSKAEKVWLSKRFIETTRITTKNIYKAPSTVSPSQISTQVRFYHGDIYPTTSTEHFA